MNRYTMFFQTSIHAHFVALLVALYRLYEIRNNTYSIPSLLHLLRTNKAMDVGKLDYLDTLYAKAKPLWIKVSILRNKAFGHRSVAHTVEEVFREAGVSPNELRDLVEQTKALLNTLTQTLQGSVHTFNLGAKEDLVRLLTDIKKWNG